MKIRVASVSNLFFQATIIVSAILVSQFLAIPAANANPHVFFPDRPNMTLPIVTLQAPTENGSYPKDNVTLDFNVTKPDSSWFWGGYGIPPSSAIASIGYYLDGKYSSVFFNSKITDGLEATSQFKIKLDNLTSGGHEVGIEIKALHFYGGATSKLMSRQNSVSFLVSFNVDGNPPAILGLSIENKTYASSTLSLSFYVNEPTWIAYSVDDQANLTVTGNLTISNLNDGSHSIVIYSNNSYGTMCQSETVFFTVAAPTPSPSPSPSLSMPPTQQPTTSPANTQTGDSTAAPILGVVVVVAVAAGVLVFFWKRKRS